MFFWAAWNVLVQLAPWMLLGTFIAGLVHVLLPSGFIRRRLQGPGGVLKAVAIGVPLPLCSCGVIPAGLGLKKDGASDGACIGFLISTPQTGVDSILVSGSFLGWPFALFKVLVAAMTGLVGGWLVDALPDHQNEAAKHPAAAAAPSGRRGLRDLLAHGLDIVRSIWLWLVFGVLVSAAINVFAPDSYLSGLGSLGILPSALAALAISIPLYVCATASVPIAAALVAGGLPTGAALVFLIAGPATNVATIGAVYRQFGGRVVAIYLGTIIAGSVLGAVAYEAFLTGMAAQTAAAHHHETHPWWAQASGLLLLGLFTWFAVADVRRWWQRRISGTKRSQIEFKIAVQGMRCANCVAHVERALQKLAGVESYVVHLEPGEAVVRGVADAAAVRQAIREAGYQTD
ncbi:MAG: permease [Pirellulaceae bacterium]|jgi:hypothetical protein|nr:permease [Pirellulaceae bacterium]MCU0979987.1 permease [Pirellulaceae bacterium]